MEKVTELHLPNTLGSEKIAMEKVTSVAKSMGFKNERIEDLKTVIAEACTNAIEHGNKFDQSTTVGVFLTANDSSLKILVRDHGNGIDPDKIPKTIITEEGFPTPNCRLGMYLISNLANEFFYENKPGIGNEVTMLFYLEN